MQKEFSYIMIKMIFEAVDNYGNDLILSAKKVLWYPLTAFICLSVGLSAQKQWIWLKFLGWLDLFWLWCHLANMIEKI